MYKIGFLSLYLSCKSSSRSMLSPDDKLSANIGLYGLEHHTVEINGDVTRQPESENRAS